jgi:hypothetical protein
MSFYSFGHRDSDDDDDEVSENDSDDPKEIMAMEDDGFYMEGEVVHITRVKPGAKTSNKERSKKR